MTIWIVGGLLALLAGVIGFFLGAVRSTVSLVGAVLGAFLAGTVGAWVGGLVSLVGFKNPIWQFYLPPLVGFLLISLLFLVIALVVHHFVQRYYRNNTDEYTFARWDRLNRRSGAAVGAVLGTVWLILFGVLVYVPGYFSTQVTSGEESSTSLNAINSLAHDTETTGLSRIIERFQPAGDEHYLASDILGLVYHNPALHSRLASYPPFLGFAEKPEVAELAKDPEVNTMIQSQAGLSQVLEHPRIRAVLDNPDLVNELLALDLKDLEGYLRTGVSEKYKNETILGRWRLNVRRSIAEMKMVPSDKLPAVEFNLLRKALNVYLDEMTIGFTTDNKAILKVKAKDEQKLMQTVGRASSSSGAGAAAAGGAGGGGGESAPATPGGGLTPRALAARAVPQQPSGQPDMDPQLRQRYGLAGGGAQRSQPLAPTLSSSTPVVVPRAPVKAPTTTTLGPLMSSGEGGWSRSGDLYKVTFSHDGKDLALDVQAKENQLTAHQDGRVLVFDRI